MKKIISILFLLFSLFEGYSQQTILWKITDTIHHKTSFIVGTFHQFGNSFVDSIPQLKSSLLNADIAIFESIYSKEELRKKINSRATSDEIKKKLKKKDYKSLLTISENWKVDIHKLKPIELRWKLIQEFTKIKCKTVVTTDKYDHFDIYLKTLAEEKGIETLGLESAKEQLNYIAKENDFPNWKDERGRIAYFINQIIREDFDSNRCDFANKYRVFDLDYQFNVACKNDVLVFERNALWMKVLPDLLQNKNCFIAVGLLHLYKQCGLLEQLKERGFIVEAIKVTR